MHGLNVYRVFQLKKFSELLHKNGKYIGLQIYMYDKVMGIVRGHNNMTLDVLEKVIFGEKAVKCEFF